MSRADGPRSRRHRVQRANAWAFEIENNTNDRERRVPRVPRRDATHRRARRPRARRRHASRHRRSRARARPRPPRARRFARRAARARLPARFRTRASARAVRRPSACRASARRRDEAKAQNALDAAVGADALGYTEPWAVELVTFWREYAGARDRVVRALVEVGETHREMRDPAQIAIAGDRLRRLLPDIDVCAVFERDPGVLKIEFVAASKRVLELQDVLCSSDMCRDVTGLIERHPQLLLVDDIHAHIERAVAKLASLEPNCDARAVVDEFPELIYRIHSYDYVESLPISIQNMLLDSASEDETRLEDYERMWDEREAADRERDDFFADDASEWMVDGFWEGPAAD